jgi:hypothetical protein
MSTAPGENRSASIFDDHLRATILYSAAQYQHALELRQRRLSGNLHWNLASDNGAASPSETRNPDYSDSRGREPDGTTSCTPPDCAPDAPDETLYWYNTMTEMQRKTGSGVSKASFRTATSSHVICQLRSPPCRNQRCYRMLSWSSFACANDIASRNVQRGTCSHICMAALQLARTPK